MRTRWWAVGIGLLASAGVALVPVGVAPWEIALATAGLVACNLAWAQGLRSLHLPSSQLVRRLLLGQVLGDYLVLSWLTWVFGCIETPIQLLYLPHILLMTLLLSRRSSLGTTLLAAALAGLPLLLEHLGLIPLRSLSSSLFKETVVASPLLTGAYLLAVFGGFLVSWLLVSEVSTSLQRRHEQLERDLELQYALSAQRRQATLRATHELKAPFAAIRSYVYTLEGGLCGPLPDEALRVVGRIGARCELLAERISDIIHLSNLQTMLPEEVTLEPVPLAEVLAAEVAEANVLGAPRGVRVQARVPAGLVLQASREHLHTLLSNLIGNAVRYSQPGGEVKVSAEPVADGVVIEVEDHGIGIDPAHLDHIFEEHFRTADASAHAPQGNGMGLPMVQQIARLHGAVVRVRSAPDEGTRFTVLFGG